jgi:hypothetical protein
MKTGAEYLSSTVQRHCCQHEPDQTSDMIFRHWTMKADSLIYFSIQYMCDGRHGISESILYHEPSKNVIQNINSIFHASKVSCCKTV